VKQVDKKEVDTEGLKQISSLASFLVDNDKPLNRVTYSDLTQENWIYWLQILSDERIEFPTVLPDKGVIKGLAATMLPNPTTTSSEMLGVLLQTLRLNPKTNEWKVVADNLVQWANNPSRALEDDLAYELMMAISTQCIDSISATIKDCVEGAGFWARGSAEVIDKVETFPILVASVLGSKMQENSSVSAAVKDYWKNESSEGSNVDALVKLNQLPLIWEMAKDELNKLAISFIRNNFLC